MHYSYCYLLCQQSGHRLWKEWMSLPVRWKEGRNFHVSHQRWEYKAVCLLPIPVSTVFSERASSCCTSQRNLHQVSTPSTRWHYVVARCWRCAGPTACQQRERHTSSRTSEATPRCPADKQTRQYRANLRVCTMTAYKSRVFFRYWVHLSPTT